MNRGRTLAAEIDRVMNEWLSVKTEIVNAVYKLPDGRERTVLIDYYCSCMTDKEIAAELGLTWRQVNSIRKTAIEHLGEVLGLE